MNPVLKVVIIGGGPSGLSAAVYNARAGLAPLVLAGSPPGGQLMLTTEVENFPGYKSILGPELVQTLRDQALSFGAQIKDQNVVSIDVTSRPFHIHTSNEEYSAESVIITTGAKALWLGLESEERLRGKGVSACATCDGFFFKNKTVAVVGGGDTALEEAQTLSRFANIVYLLHRRSELRASKIMQQRIFDNKHIKVMWNVEIAEILGDMKVEGVRLKGTLDPFAETQLKLDGVFVAIGHKPDTSVFAEGIQLDEKGYILTGASHALAMAHTQTFEKTSSFNFNYPSMTSVPGIFAAGDCVDLFYRQASTAAGMGVGASLDAERWLIHES